MLYHKKLWKPELVTERVKLSFKFATCTGWWKANCLWCAVGPPGQHPAPPGPAGVPTPGPLPECARELLQHTQTVLPQRPATHPAGPAEKLTWQGELQLELWRCIYASPSSGEAYRDRRLTTNFELWVEIFCVPTCFHMRIPKPCVCLFVRLSAPREKISPYLRQYQSNISNWYINGMVFTSTTPWKPKSLIFFFKKVWNLIRLVFWLAHLI